MRVLLLAAWLAAPGLIGCAVTAPMPAHASAGGSASQPTVRGLLNLDGRRLAVRGYDVVAYFEQGAAVEGVKDHTVRWRGGLFRFASAENAARFRAEPKRFAPQYGGYCAWAVSQGYTADADPTQWAIVDGKLYLNYDETISARWKKDQVALITRGDRNWPRVLSR